MRVLTREHAARVDRCASEQFGISGLVLMENAGRAATDLLCQLQVKSPIVVCCGKGNNAGDGYVIARHLLARNYQVQVLNWEKPEKIQGDARTNYRILQAMGARIVEQSDVNNANVLQILADAYWIVDALLGTRGSGPPRHPIDKAIEAINHAQAIRFAVDLPSGLDCDTGCTPGVAIEADHTCTFLAAKPGLIHAAGKAYVGQLHIADLGISTKIIQAALGEHTS